METMRAKRLLPDDAWDESPVDLYLRLCREVTMLEARAAELLAEIDRGGLIEDAGYRIAAQDVINGPSCDLKQPQAIPAGS